MALIKCSECGAEVSERASVCPKCGCPVEVFIENDKKIKKIRYIIIPIVALIIIVAVLGGIYKFINKPDASGYFEKYKWGTSYTEMQKKLGGEAVSNDEEKTVLMNYEDYQDKQGIDTLIAFDCAEDSLNKITLFITNGDDSSYTGQNLMDEYIDEFNNLYGEYEEDSLSYIWMTEKSKITLTFATTNLLIIAYEDITKSTT